MNNSSTGLQNETTTDQGFQITQGEIEAIKLMFETQKYLLEYIQPVLMGLFGGAGNLLIILYFLKTNIKSFKKMSSYHFLIINLAVADFLTCIGTSVFFPFLVKGDVQAKRFACHYGVDFSAGVCPLTSCWILVWLSYSRYRSIVEPFKPGFSKRKWACVCTLTWVLSQLVFLYLLFKRRFIEEHQFCIIDVNDLNIFVQMLCLMAIDCVLPVSLMTYFYHQMKRKLFEEERKNTFTLNDQSRRRNRIALRNIKNLNIVYAVFVIPGRFIDALVYITLWLDLNDGFLFNELFKHYLSLIYALSNTAVYLNNACNIIVYIKLVSGFRRFLADIFCCGFLRE